MTMFDLSHPIEDAMPVYPGTPPVHVAQRATIEQDGFAEKSLTFTSHTGTHMDAPAHMVLNGQTLDQLPLETFVGRACVVDVAEDGALIQQSTLQSAADLIARADFVLLDSGWWRRWKQPDYYQAYPTLSPEAAEWLVTFKLKGVGVDVASVDPINADTFRIHGILFAANFVIIENLTNLDRLPRGRLFGFAALPLPIRDADGAPVRALAWLDAPTMPLS
ncbi:MAG: cyclase family protein [Ardenticatenia bacterium]|nr:MAG: cyclase family protein [Ardenticatenia bacterium]